MNLNYSIRALIFLNLISGSSIFAQLHFPLYEKTQDGKYYLQRADAGKKTVTPR